MKKKILSFCLAFALIIPAIFLLSACGGGNDTPKKDRTNTAEIVSVYQDYRASLYVEMTGFEHDEYELTGSIRNNLTLEFSINNGEWFECYPVQDFYDESGKGVYQILSAIYNYGDSEVSYFTTMMTDQNIEPGEISISARIPESNKYNASVGSEAKTYILKQNIQTSLSEKLSPAVASLGSQGSSNTFQEEQFIFYQDSSNPYNLKVGKYYSQANSNGGYDYLVRELTEDEKTEFSALNLEYKVLNYDTKYITTVEGSQDESIDTLSIQADENDSVYFTEGWTDSLNLDQSNHWTYVANNFYYEDVIFLVRQKATDNTVQSEAICFQAPIESREQGVQDNPDVYEGFVFDDNKLIGYLGNETEIVVPSSYSIRNTNTDIYTIEYNIRDIINYGDESSLDYEIWAEDLNEYDIFILVGGMYNVSINNGENQYVRVGETEEFFTQVKEKYTDPTTTISIELTDYTLSVEDEIDESNLTIILRPFIEMVAGNLESFSMTYDGETVNFTKENYLQQFAVFNEIISAGSLKSNISYDVGNYIEYIEGDDYQVNTITSLSPDYVLGGGLFAIPQLTKITIPASITTIDEGVFEGISTLSSVIVESATIYNTLNELNACGNLITSATKIKVLKNIVDNTANINEFLNTTGGYTRTEDGNYYVFTK